MKLTASGATDASNIVLFWPDAMPDGADAGLADNPLEFVERLRNEGKQPPTKIFFSPH